MVPRTGFEPVNDCLEGNCRSPLGDRGIKIAGKDLHLTWELTNGKSSVHRLFSPYLRLPIPPPQLKWSMGSLLLGVIANFFFHQVNVAAQNTGHPDALDHGGTLWWIRTTDLFLVREAFSRWNNRAYKGYCSTINYLQGPLTQAYFYNLFLLNGRS